MGNEIELPSVLCGGVRRDCVVDVAVCVEGAARGERESTPSGVHPGINDVCAGADAPVLSALSVVHRVADPADGVVSELDHADVCVCLLLWIYDAVGCARAKD